MAGITTTTKVTIGVDLGDRYSHSCTISASGELLDEGRVLTTASAIRARFGGMEPGRIVLEAGTHSAWVSRLLSDHGHEVIVANPRRLRLIYEADKKNDRVDARYLARLGRLDSEPELRITKAGSPMLRRLLVGSAHYILGPFGPDTDLRRWGLEIATRGGKNAKNRAVVAVARKLTSLLYSLWSTAELYEPLRNSSSREEQVPQPA